MSQNNGRWWGIPDNNDQLKHDDEAASGTTSTGPDMAGAKTKVRPRLKKA